MIVFCRSQSKPSLSLSVALVWIWWGCFIWQSFLCSIQTSATCPWELSKEISFLLYTALIVLTKLAKEHLRRSLINPYNPALPLQCFTVHVSIKQTSLQSDFIIKKITEETLSLSACCIFTDVCVCMFFYDDRNVFWWKKELHVFFQRCAEINIFIHRLH